MFVLVTVLLLCWNIMTKRDLRKIYLGYDSGGKGMALL